MNGCIARRTTIRSRSCRIARCSAIASRRSWPPRPRASRVARSCTWTWITSSASTTRWDTAPAINCCRIVAHRLKACTKEGDTVARLGGDEFTVLLRNVGDADTVRQIAERVIRSLALPANLGGRDYQMRASVGVTLFPDDGVDLEEVIRQADLAMYRAKSQGRGRAVFFERDMAQRRASFTDSGLHRALRRREFALVLPAAVLAGRWPVVWRGSLAALADALRRHQATRRIHPRRRAFRTHHRHRRLRARFRLRAVRGVAARRRRAAHVLGERVGTPDQGRMAS